VAWRNIERSEIVIIVLDFGAVGDIEPHLHEQGLEPLQRAGNRMRTALAYAASRERHIQCFTRQLLVTGG
jgi:hypothetical protein